MRCAVGQGLQQRNRGVNDQSPRCWLRASPPAGRPFASRRWQVWRASLRIVVSEQFWLFLYRLRKLLLQCFGYPPVLDAPIRPEQRMVGSVLNQRVLERVACLRRVATLEDQLGFGKPSQRPTQLVLGKRGQPEKLV